MIKKAGGNLLKLFSIVFFFTLLYSCVPKVTGNQEKLTKKEPESKYEAYYHFTLSKTNFLHGNFKEALREIETAEKYDPNSAFLKYNVALVYISVNQFKLALGKLEEAVRIDPNLAPAHTLLGKIFAASDDSRKICDYRP